MVVVVVVSPLQAAKASCAVVSEGIAPCTCHRRPKRTTSGSAAEHLSGFRRKSNLIVSPDNLVFRGISVVPAIVADISCFSSKTMVCWSLCFYCLPLSNYTDHARTITRSSSQHRYAPAGARQYFRVNSEKLPVRESKLC